ncbi:MAG: DNA-3-methyladenine glycosylase [Rhodopseudomonas palustris]|nr:DNA-3-methyladenine glycosylase [Rhodopseudomonas palustris]
MAHNCLPLDASRHLRFIAGSPTPEIVTGPRIGITKAAELSVALRAAPGSPSCQ